MERDKLLLALFEDVDLVMPEDKPGPMFFHHLNQFE